MSEFIDDGDVSEIVRDKNVQKRYVCTKCERVFKSKRSFVRHIGRITDCYKIYDETDFFRDSIQRFTADAQLFHDTHNYLVKYEMQEDINKRFLYLANLYFSFDANVRNRNDMRVLFFDGILPAFADVHKAT